jgi:hypothetical protein
MLEMYSSPDLSQVPGFQK